MFYQKESSPQTNFVIRPTQALLHSAAPEMDMDVSPLLTTEYNSLPAPFPMAPSIQKKKPVIGSEDAAEQQQKITSQVMAPMTFASVAMQHHLKAQRADTQQAASANESDQKKEDRTYRESKTLQIPSKRKTKKSSMARLNFGLGLINDLEHGHEQHDAIHNEVNVSDDLYSSLMGRLQSEKLSMELQKGAVAVSTSGQTPQNGNKFANLLQEYQTFQKEFVSSMTILQREKKELHRKLKEAEKEEKSAIDILQQITVDHASLENRIRPQMKQLLYQQTRLEQRLNYKLDQLSPQQLNAMMNDLSYYQKYIKELNQTLQQMNVVRTQFVNSIRECMQTKTSIEQSLRQNQDRIERLQQQTQTRMAQFVGSIKQLMPQPQTTPNGSEKALSAKSGDSLVQVLSAEDEKLTHDFELLAFRLSTIPVVDYVNRLIEICQLSFIYQQDKLKDFFEYFVRFSIQTFIEISFAHSCFVNKNEKAIADQLPRIETIKFIAELTPGDLKNKEPYESSLRKELAVIQEYLDLLPDRDMVVSHVARHLSANVIHCSEIDAAQDSQIPMLAKQRVKEWVATILGPSQSTTKGEKNKTRTRPLLYHTKNNPDARVDSTQAAIIVLNYAFGVYPL
ncbi:hypothetical protein RFI_18761 [Reticulomyxa filosa]|uniref:Uncharacterized protein n=1 Tax=Reticulomyxa filosa TaxID=46433 RepID=X6MXG4_RETFI|nr:hypothetical protein RFI_18761 [Reticulomyxa filosa]|eukprot:ETO18504.1 hypothetical protein RFI_18761 [Reticulomyxa filosa]